MDSETTIIGAIKSFLRDNPEVPFTLNDLEKNLNVHSRRQIRSAVGVACREYANYFRIDDSTFMFSERKHLQFYDGRMKRCGDCGSPMLPQVDSTDHSIALDEMANAVDRALNGSVEAVANGFSDIQSHVHEALNKGLQEVCQAMGLDITAVGETE